MSKREKILVSILIGLILIYAISNVLHRMNRVELVNGETYSLNNNDLLVSKDNEILLNEGNNVVSSNEEEENNKVLNTSLKNGEKVIEYNNKIYFTDSEKMYEITGDLQNAKVLAENISSFKIYNDKIYSNKICVNLKNGEITNLDNLIYIDEDMLLLQPTNNIFKIIRNSDNYEETICLQNGEFIKRIDNKLFFQQNMIDYSSLYYLEIGNSSLNLINKEERAALWYDPEIACLFEEELYGGEDWQRREFMEIRDAALIEDKVYYAYSVCDCDLSKNGVGAGGYDKRIIEVNLSGDNRKVEVIRTIAVDDERTMHAGPYLRYSENDNKVEGINYELSFEKDYVSILDEEYIEVAKIMKSSPNSYDTWMRGGISELENYFYVYIVEGEYFGWREWPGEYYYYFIKNDGSKAMLFNNGKLIEAKDVCFVTE